jgi:hypothetical protein
LMLIDARVVAKNKRRALSMSAMRNVRASVTNTRAGNRRSASPALPNRKLIGDDGYSRGGGGKTVKLITVQGFKNARMKDWLEKL